MRAILSCKSIFASAFETIPKILTTNRRFWLTRIQFRTLIIQKSATFQRSMLRYVFRKVHQFVVNFHVSDAAMKIWITVRNSVFWTRIFGQATDKQWSGYIQESETRSRWVGASRKIKLSRWSFKKSKKLTKVEKSIASM